MGTEFDNFLLDVLIMAFGAVSILNGRRLYWVFVGIGGAVLGLILSTWVIPEQAEWIHILVMVTLGIGGALLARLDKKIAVRAAAFVLGGFILHFLALDTGLVELGTAVDLIAIVIGGIIGVALDVIYDSSALIVISSFCGAALVVAPLQASDAFRGALFSGLAAVGMLLQSREWVENKVKPKVTVEPFVDI